MLGIGNVMFDLDTIPFGVDFRTYLDKMVSDCEYMLVIIGPNWLTAADAWVGGWIMPTTGCASRSSRR